MRGVGLGWNLERSPPELDVVDGTRSVCKLWLARLSTPTQVMDSTSLRMAEEHGRKMAALRAAGTA